MSVFRLMRDGGFDIVKLTKKLAAKRYTERKLSFDELADILGYEEAKKVAYYKNIAEASFAEDLE